MSRSLGGPGQMDVTPQDDLVDMLAAPELFEGFEVHPELLLYEVRRPAGADHPGVGHLRGASSALAPIQIGRGWRRGFGLMETPSKE